jgi:MarR family transcriptional regulator, repressor for mepA
MENHRDVGYMIHLISNKIKKKANHELDNQGITSKQGRFLGYLHERQGRVTTQKDLQEHFEITHPTTIGIIKRLEQKNLVTTRTSEADRRIKIVELAPEEEKIHKKMMRFSEEMDTLLLRGLEEEERVELARLLEKVSKNLKD